MARALTSGELTHLRTDGQKSRLFLAVLTPSTVLQRRLNGAPASTDQVVELTYDDPDGGTGVYGDVVVGQTLYVSAVGYGKFEKGLARIRKVPTSTKIYIGEESEIKFEDNDYLTIVNEFGLWPKHLRIDSSGVIYVDYDVVYTDQHANCDPVPVLGPPAVVWLTSSDVDVEFNAGDSWVTGSTISGYSWSASGSSASSGMATATPTITYDAAGTYLVSCTVSATTGASFTGYRYVFVFDDDNPPSTVLRTDTCGGNWSAGGWSFRITAWDDATLTDIRDRTLVVLFARDWYGSTEVSIGPVPDRENVISVGWIAGETITQNPEQSEVSFTVQGPHWWLGQMTGFPSGIEDYAGVPTSWIEFNNLTVDKGLWHFLHWRTTLTAVSDVQLTDDTRQISVFDTPSSSLWQQLAQAAESTILAHPCCDRYGRLFIEIDSQLLPTPDRVSIPIVQALTSIDWKDQITIERQTISPASLLDLSGVAYQDGAGSPLFSLATGHVPKRYGGIERRDRLALTSQAQANTLAGLVLGNLTNEYPHIGIPVAANHRMVDVCPHQYVTMTLVAADTERGIVWTNFKVIPRSVSLQYSADDGSLVVDWECEGYTTETLAVDGDPPPTPPVPPSPPAPPAPLSPPGEEWEFEGTIKACVAWHSKAVGYTSDLLERHFIGTTTVGTTGTALYDTSADFVSLGAVVGDVVENLTDSVSTHVAVVVSAQQLTLDADIGLGVGDEYSLCGTQWTDVTPPGFTPAASEWIIQLLYTRTSENTVGAWLLTTHNVFYTSNVLTASPSWTAKLAITTVQAHIGHGGGLGCVFKGMHAWIADPNYLIVSFTHDGLGCTYGCVYTGNLGDAWSYSVFLQTDGHRGCPKYAIEIDEATGEIFHIRSFTGNPCYIYWSTNDGATFTLTKPSEEVASWTHVNSRADLYRPVAGTSLAVTIQQSLTSPGTSPDDGLNWALLVAAGYTPGVFWGLSGWVGDANDLLCMWERTVDNIQVLLRSSDAGASWVEIGNSHVCFPWVPFGGSLRCYAPETWQPSTSELVWTGVVQRGAGAESCRLKYTSNNGTHWSGKMGNWYQVFLSYPWVGEGVYGCCGCLPLPRVGANA